HPYGYGKEVYFWTLVVAMLIFAGGGGVSVYEGIRHLRHPEPLGDPTLSFVVLGLAVLFEGAAWTVAFREFGRLKGERGWWEAIRKGKDPTAFAVLLEDSAALSGLLVAGAGIWLGHRLDEPLYDGAASVLIGVILAGVAAVLAWEARGLLVGAGGGSPGAPGGGERRPGAGAPGRGDRPGGRSGGVGGPYADHARGSGSGDPGPGPPLPS
ncbi:MAG: cation transporter, partial [Gemmatimonadetes bacterium]|nr:cation transporter [Gemmatimonadota bacterium]NIR79734.1 cation transporter [Gemmatimonadota bacterium]NIT88438.1 cation transporter [Gemmatimonadota bacterium]NIU32253.1 cation transporter [Gemmatimonadota bacterium]NIU36794.1 cation transporter [Gemmatimonadota bacterium]